MENQKEMVEFVKWIITNPEEIVAAINGMSQSEEGKKSLQELFAKFKASKQKFQMGGVIPRTQYGGDTLRHMTLRPIVTTGYLEPIGEDRTVARRYPTYSPGAASARREFYTEDGYARRINGNDTTGLKRRPIAYTPAGNPENKEDANYVHIWEEVMPTSWLRAMFNGVPDSVESPEIVESKQPGGKFDNNDLYREDPYMDYRSGVLRDGRTYSARAERYPGGTRETYNVGERMQNGKLQPAYELRRDIQIQDNAPVDTIGSYRIKHPTWYDINNEPYEKVVSSSGYNNMKIWGGSEDVNMGDKNAKVVRDQINSIIERLNLKK